MIQGAKGDLGSAAIGTGGTVDTRNMNLSQLLEAFRSGRTAEQSGLAGQMFGMRQGDLGRLASVAQLLYGMGQGDARTSQAQLLSGAQNAAALPRTLGIQDLIRQQQLTSALLGVPLTAMPTTSAFGTTDATSSGTQTGTQFGTQTGSQTGTASREGNMPFRLGNLLGPFANILGAGLLNPKGAEALLGGIGNAAGGIGSLVGGLGRLGGLGISSIADLISASPTSVPGGAFGGNIANIPNMLSGTEFAIDPSIADGITDLFPIEDLGFGAEFFT